MTLEELKQKFHKKLKQLYNVNEIDSVFLIYLEDKLNLIYQADKFLENEEDVLKDLIELEKGKPVQHIVGKAFFYDYFFKVNEFTLIPRPETEELIYIISEDFDKNKELDVIDLGTGSGCIPITINKIFSKANVSAIDVSSEALEIAKENAKELGTTINFIQQDLLVDFNLNKKFDVITSNPPYIRNLEKEEMHQNVLNFEPHLALFVEDNNALIFYERVITFAKNHLNNNGVVYCEINQYLGKETQELFEENFKNVELLKDISGNDRIVKASILK